MFPGVVTVSITATIVGGEQQEAENEVTVARPTPAARRSRWRRTAAPVVEVEKVDGKWQVVRDGAKNRRITGETPMTITGPAAGHPRLQTTADPDRHPGARHAEQLRRRRHALGHRADGRGELPQYFTGELPEDHPEAANYDRLGLPDATYAWGEFHDRFDLAKEPNEPNRFGWVVEIDVTTRPRRRRSAPRSAASSTRAARPSSRRRPGRRLHRRRRALRLRLQVRHRGPLRPRRPRRQPGPARRRHALRRPLQRRRHGRVAAAGPRRGAADRGERLREPGRRADRDAPRRRPARRDEDGPAGGLRAATPTPAGSTWC